MQSDTIPSQPTDRQPINGGDAIGARYRPVSALGLGGLGEVLACEDTMLHRTVAVKAGNDTRGLDMQIILEREARIISQLEHPNIIPIYDAGIDPQRGPYYVMRQVTEASLAMILHHRNRSEGNPHDYSLNRLLRYFLQICNAVDYAHHRGVIHCDIKPANILLGDYGEVLLVDWGLAQSRDYPLGVRGGTLGYMAPEQLDALLRTSVQNCFIAVFADLDGCHTLAMVTGELLENALKYGDWSSANRAMFRLRVVGRQRNTEVSVQNPINGGHHTEKLLATLEWIKANAPDFR